MIAIGGTNIVKAYLGQTELKNIAIGDELLLSSEPLPYDAEIEYLEGDGAAYINTEVFGSTNLKAVAAVDVTNIPPTGSSFIFSSRVSYNSKGFGVVFNGTAFANNPSKFRFDLGSSNKLSGVVSSGQHTIILDAPSRLGTIDDVNNYSLSSSAFSNTVNIILFGMNNNGSVTPQQGMRIKSYKLYSNASLLQDMIPVRVGTDGYMYDKVSKTLFGNAGTGDFILGSDV